MTGILQTIDEIHAHLDECPDDHAARMVLADALEEAGGEQARLAPGYRALGRTRKRPQAVVMNEDVIGALHDTQWVFGRRDNVLATDPDYGRDVLRCCLLRRRWFFALPYTTRVYSFNVDKEDRSWEHFPSRREAEDAAALAYRLKFEKKQP